MRWWDDSHRKYKEWIDDGAIESDGSFLECCYAKCMNCRKEISAVLRFQNKKIVSLESIGKEDDWPKEFPK